MKAGTVQAPAATVVAYRSPASSVRVVDRAGVSAAVIVAYGAVSFLAAACTVLSRGTRPQARSLHSRMVLPGFRGLFAGFLASPAGVLETPAIGTWSNGKTKPQAEQSPVGKSRWPDSPLRAKRDDVGTVPEMASSPMPPLRKQPRGREPLTQATFFNI